MRRLWVFVIVTNNIAQDEAPRCLFTPSYTGNKGTAIPFNDANLVLINVIAAQSKSV